jgi:NAD(P)-dependent dehydrogenase (short-subunit alcohol dehydrogenase family)
MTVRPGEALEVLVVGGAGHLGGLIAMGLLDAGARVVVPSRSAARLAELEQRAGQRPGTLVTVHSGPVVPTVRADVVDRIRSAAPRLRAVVAAIGGFDIGPALIDLPSAGWESALADHLTSHLAAMQTYAPLLVGATDPVYVTMNGAAAYQPMSGSGAICVTGAAQRMLMHVMRVEPIGATVRFHEIAVMAAVAGDQRNLTPVAEVSPDEVVTAVMRVLGDPGSPAVTFLGGHP